VHYFNSTDTQGTRLPLPPISVAVDSTRPFGRIKVRMSAAQVGSIPTSLELLADALLVEPDTKGNLLYIAARKQLEN
jgi:hypothetical protein